METISQLRKWKDQADAADKHSAADMDVAKRLLNHALEAHDMIEQLRQFHHDQQELHEMNDALHQTNNILREQLADKHQLFMCASANYDRLAEQLATVTAERDDLVAALSKYGHHIEGCGHGWSCSCGFYAALAKLGADKTGDV